MTTTLKKAFEKAAELPDLDQEAFAKFLLEELEFVAAIQEGVEAADRGEVVRVKEARKMTPKWITQSSSHGPR